MSDLYRLTLPWMLNIHRANNLGFSRCRYYARPTGEDGITVYSCLHTPQRFQPHVLLLNSCLNPGMNRNRTVVKSNLCSASIETFKSFSRKYSIMTANNARFQEPVKFCTCGSLLDFSCRSILGTEQRDVTLWNHMKCALLCYPPASPTNDSVTYFSTLQRLNRSLVKLVGCSNNSCLLYTSPSPRDS